MNHLYYGDNLTVLRESIADESVDLIYLDPPFNSNATYSHLFKDESGQVSGAQIAAFDDTWHWDDMVSGRALIELRDSPYQDAAKMLDAMVGFLGKNPMTAYLAMMAVRLVELHRVLRPTGSLYLHCDPTASHYLKILLDAVFGARQFHNEIVWKRTSSHGNVSANYGDVTDTIFYYSKSGSPTWHKPYVPLSDENIKKNIAMLMIMGGCSQLVIFGIQACGLIFTTNTKDTSLIRMDGLFPASSWKNTTPKAVYTFRKVRMGAFA